MVDDKKLHVSFSQLGLWMQCPLLWKLNYIDKLKTNETNIHFLFGKAMHETLQDFLQEMYAT